MSNQPRDPRVRTLIDNLDLSPHPEGGYYRETFRSACQVRTPDAGRKRCAGTGIYFLLPAGVCTNWHRVRSDELWHFYEGDPVVLEVITKTGQYERIELAGQADGQYAFQGLAPAQCWQRAWSAGSYSLVGCTVTPGFEFEDFEMQEAGVLAERYPRLKGKITHHPFGK